MGEIKVIENVVITYEVGDEEYPTREATERAVLYNKVFDLWKRTGMLGSYGLEEPYVLDWVRQSCPNRRDLQYEVLRMSDIDEIMRETETAPKYQDDEPSQQESPEWDPKTGVRPKKPSMWHVVLLNDDFTPMEFVVVILQKIFRKGFDEATAIMLEAHKKGRGIAGTYNFEIAETKALETIQSASLNGYPLKAVVQEAPNG